MRVVKLIILTFCLSKISHTQTIYESPLGFTLSFDKTWKQIPKDVLHQRKKEVNDFLEYKKDIQFDIQPQRQAYLVLIEGAAMINGHLLTMRDGLETLEESLHIEAQELSHLLLIELAR